MPANNVQVCINREMGSVIAAGTGLLQRRVHAVSDGAPNVPSRTRPGRTETHFTRVHEEVLGTARARLAKSEALNREA